MTIGAVTYSLLLLLNQGVQPLGADLDQTLFFLLLEIAERKSEYA